MADNWVEKPLGLNSTDHCTVFFRLLNCWQGSCTVGINNVAFPCQGDVSAIRYTSYTGVKACTAHIFKAERTVSVVAVMVLIHVKAVPWGWN